MTTEKAPRETIVQTLSRLSRNYTVSPRYSNQIEMKIPGAENVSVLSYCKNYGFRHLSNIACIDRIADDRFEVLYNLWSYIHKIHLTLKACISRQDPVLVSVLSLWPQAQVYEQEIHEFFGVVFEGNPDLGPLFLHNWLDTPPMRKDFDSEEYAKQAYGFLGEDSGEDSNAAGGRGADGSAAGGPEGGEK